MAGHLNFRSHHHLRVKFGIVKCLSQRARKICSSEARKREEIKLIKEVSIHSEWILIDEIMKKRPSKKGNTTDDKGKHVPLLVLPYIQSLSKKISKTCHKYNKTAFTACPTLRNLLVKVKSQPPSTSRLGIVYCIPHSCGCVYIGDGKMPRCQNYRT